MVHVFKQNDINAAIDTNSGSVHILDDITYDLLNNENFKEKSKLDMLNEKYGKQAISEALEEIQSLIDKKMLYSDEVILKNKIKPVFKALCLNVAHDCNLKCDYCFASQGDFGGRRLLMPFEVGKKAFDFLIENSGNRRNLEVDFFGGEPLMNFDTVKRLVEYGRKIEKEKNKNFRFTITTNGVLLDDEKIDYINKNCVNVVLSLDGRKEVNDNMRKTINNQGSYDFIVKKFQDTVKRRKGETYFARGTFTNKNLDFTNDVIHMRDLGFKSISIEPVVTDPQEEYALREEHIEIIKKEYEKLALEYLESKKSEDKRFSFFHFNIDLNDGPCLYKKSIGCGAGTEYIAVTPEGHIYPCHQFVGNEDFIMGNVDKGIIDQKIYNMFGNVSVNSKEKCRDCWAKYYCSGGCHANAYNFNHDINEPYNIACELEKKRIECSIMIKAKEEYKNDN